MSASPKEALGLQSGRSFGKGRIGQGWCAGAMLRSSRHGDRKEEKESCSLGHSAVRHIDLQGAVPTPPSTPVHGTCVVVSVSVCRGCRSPLCCSEADRLLGRWPWPAGSEAQWPVPSFAYDQCDISATWLGRMLATSAASAGRSGRSIDVASIRPADGTLTSGDHVGPGSIVVTLCAICGADRSAVGRRRNGGSRRIRHHSGRDQGQENQTLR
jgi:hypothetical protein